MFYSPMKCNITAKNLPRPTVGGMPAMSPGGIPRGFARHTSLFNRTLVKLTFDDVKSQQQNHFWNVMRQEAKEELSGIQK